MPPDRVRVSRPGVRVSCDAGSSRFPGSFFGRQTFRKATMVRSETRAAMMSTKPDSW